MSELFERAKVHIDRGEIDAAVQCLLGHLNGDFADAHALLMLGACFLEKGHAGIAAALTRQSIDIMEKRKLPLVGQALLNLAQCYKTELDMETAEALWKRALEVETIPEMRAKLYNNLGGRWVNEGDPEKAVGYLDECLKLRPDMLTAQFNRSFAHLEMGNWQQGWIDHQIGFKSGDRRTRHYRDIPEWDGSSGKTIIVWGEQGVGDEILYASCLPDLAKVSKKVIFDCHPRLIDLFKRSFPEVEIHGTRKTLSELKWLEEVEADASVCISTLPLFFRNRDEDFPGKPYLRADPSPEMSYLGRHRIGIAWAGGTKKTRQDLRSIPLMEWQPIFQALRAAQLKDLEVYSLQYTPNAAREVCEFEEATGLRVKHFPSWVEHKDYDRTATFVSRMDLVITVGTAVHHLSNALGVPTWTLCPAKPSWRYTEKARLWYAATNRQFRQEKTGEWAPVLDEVAKALKEHF